ncbi:MAG: PD-(D/E)XK nuclease family protein [Sporomusaceae bacterium]|nr:PD-(D/E)XK nuclease family protein [Sporomusaceae bacterium]
MGDYMSEFSWSLSRAKTFYRCRRGYYYHYYASQYDPNIALLKGMQTLPSFVGSVLHSVAKTAIWCKLATGSVEEDLLLLLAMEKLNETMSACRDKANWARLNSKKVVMLQEAYYFMDASLIRRIEGFREKIKLLVNNLVASQTLKEIDPSKSRQVLEVDRLTDFRFEGTKIFVKLDLLDSIKAPIYVIRDFKTGDTVDMYQPPLYTLAVMNRFAVPQDTVETYIEYLNHNQAKRFPVTTRLIDHTAEFMRTSIAEMKGFLKNRAKNTPLSADAFPGQNNDEICYRCNFIEVCDQYKGKAFLKMVP